MPDTPEAGPPDKAALVIPSPGLVALLAEAQETWVARGRDGEDGRPGWRPFEDAFPTFYQFTNRPR